MKAIWKYPIERTDLQTIEMPEGACILSAQIQHDQICLWVLVSPSKPLRRRKIRIFGTGHFVGNSIDGELFIDTVQQAGGALVWHIFEELPCD